MCASTCLPHNVSGDAQHAAPMRSGLPPSEQQQRLWTLAELQSLFWSAMMHSCMCSVWMLATEESESEKQVANLA